MTNREKLRKLYPDHFARILECTLSSRNGAVNELDHPALRQVLSCVFTWGDTDEGHDYWSLLFRNVEGSSSVSSPDRGAEK